MNLLHMKYAVEVADTHSLNKAAKRLYVGQPNLSRAIKELESSLGITIFERSSEGVLLTPDGEIFIRYAKSILKQIDDVEFLFTKERTEKKRFSISVPRASYIADAFAKFTTTFSLGDKAELFYKETNAKRAISNILQEDYRLGIIRYAENYDKFYRESLEEKSLSYDLVAEFHYVLIMSKDSPLASLDKITYDDLRNYVEIAHADPYVPSLSFAEVKKEELPDGFARRIFLFERGSQFDLLVQNPECFMWVSPIPEELLTRYNLVERECEENKRIYRDVLIHRKDYRLSDIDKKFIELLFEAKRAIIDPMM